MASIVTRPATIPVSDANFADKRPKNFRGIGTNIEPIKNSCNDGWKSALATKVPRDATIAVLEINMKKLWMD